MGEHAAEVRQGIDDAVPAQDGAGADDAVAADFGVVTDDGAEFLQAGGNALVAVAQDDFGAIQPHIGQDDSSSEMGFVAEDGIAHIIEVRNFTVVEEHTVFELAGVPQHAVVTHDDVLPHIAPSADLAVLPDPRGPFDVGARLDDGTFAQKDVLTHDSGGMHRAEDGRFEMGFQVVADTRQSRPNRLPIAEQSSVSGVREIEVVGSGKHDGQSRWLNRHDFLFLRDDVLIQLNDFLVRVGLNFFFGAMKIVLCDEAVFFEFLDGFKSITTRGADADLGIFAHALNGLHHLLTAFGGEVWNGQADDLAFNRRIESDVGLQDAALDVLERRRIKRLDADQAWLRRGDHGELLQLHVAAVRADVDVHVFHQTWRGFTGADAREFMTGVFDGLVHVVFCGFDSCFEGHGRKILEIKTQDKR